MRIVVAPDSFGGVLSAPEAAAAIAAGWRSVAPDDVLDEIPLSDGGPGFVDVVHTVVGGTLHRVEVDDPLGRPVAATFLVVADVGYVESAQAIGLQLVTEAERDPRVASSYGLGRLVREAMDAGVRRLVVGVGGTGTNDGGAGLWAGLGGEPAEVLRRGPLAAATAAPLCPPPAFTCPVTVATDVDNPLLGPNGASAVFGPQKGADRATVLDLDDALRAWAELVEAATGRAGVRDLPGAGAGGGCGFALLALGADRAGGLGVVAEATRLAARVAAADVVVTGEGMFDATSLRGKVVSGVAALGRDAGVPCIVVAGRAEVGRRDAAAAGIDAAYDVVAAEGSPERALAAGAAGVSAAAARAARDWGGVGRRG